MNGENSDLVKYTVKELLLEIREQISGLDKRLDQLEKDMQEGRETVKSMLLPDYHAFKALVTASEKDVQAHLASLDKLIDADQKFHALNVPTFKVLVDRVDALERGSATAEAVGKYKKWLLLTAVPAALGAAWALLKIAIFISGNGTLLP